MNLIKDEIFQNHRQNLAWISTMPHDQQIDHNNAAAIAERAQTILISAQQILDLLPALERYEDTDIENRPPFNQICIQFDQPISEMDLMEEEAHDSNRDAVLALLIHQSEDEDTIHNQAIFYYASKSVNRVYWQGNGGIASTTARNQSAMTNQLRIRQLAIATVAYINCVNIELQERHPPRHERRRAEREGNPVPEPWHICAIRQSSGTAGTTGTGVAHGHRYDVRGHFRRLSDGRLTWVRSHQRGLEHTHYVPKVYKID